MLIALSTVLYYVYFLIYHDAHHIFVYLLEAVAFVPIQVLLVTLIIEGLLNIREKKSKMAKLNMVIGTFYSDTGTKLAEYFFKFDPDGETIRNDLVIDDDWTNEKFSSAINVLRNHKYNLQIEKIDLEGLRCRLLEKRKFMMRLLENPNLLEHDNFTDMLWAIFHLTEELVARNQFSGLSKNDIEHLRGDMKRAYKAIIFEWIAYMKHLKAEYPYLFSLAMRTNPFNPNASVYVP